MGYEYRAGSRNNQALLLEAASKTWQDVAEGRAPALEALSKLCSAVDADAAALTRYDPKHTLAGKVTAFDRRPEGAFVPKLKKSFALAVLGSYAGKARKGTVWTSSAVEDLQPELREFQIRRDFRELIVIPLEGLRLGNDYLELHFHYELSTSRLVALETLAPELSQSWSYRNLGSFFERSLSKRRFSEEPGGPVLSSDNPAGLSRTEYRVCLLLSIGQSNESITTNMSISSATLRTHLRNIYQKVGVENKPELIYQLLSRGNSAAERMLA